METENKNVSDEKIIEDFIKKYGVKNILKQIDEEEIVDFYEPDDLLDYIDERDIADYLESRNFDFEPYVDTSEIELKAIKEYENDELKNRYHLMNLFARVDFPNGFITKDMLRDSFENFVNDEMPGFLL